MVWFASLENKSSLRHSIYLPAWAAAFHVISFCWFVCQSRWKCIYIKERWFFWFLTGIRVRRFFFFLLMYNSVRDAWVDQQFVKTLKWPLSNEHRQHCITRPHRLKQPKKNVKKKKPNCYSNCTGDDRCSQSDSDFYVFGLR